MEQCEWSNMVPYLKKASAVAASLQTKFYRLFNALVKGETGSTSVLNQQSLLLDVLSLLFGQYGESSLSFRASGAESQSIEAVMQHLEIRYADRVTLNDLATLVNLNPHYLIHSFHQQVAGVGDRRTGALRHPWEGDGDGISGEKLTGTGSDVPGDRPLELRFWALALPFGD